MITIWGRPNSINVQKVTWFIAELGLENNRIDCGGPFGGLDTPEFLAMNPNGLIPVIQDGEQTIWDSHAILRYLAAQYSSGDWWPEDPATRSLGDRWMEWVSAQLWPAMHPVFWGLIRTPEAERNYAHINAQIDLVNAFMKRIDAQLEGKAFLTGDNPVFADVPLGAFLYRYLNMDFERPELSSLKAYYDRLTDRSPYRDHVMLPIT